LLHDQQIIIERARGRARSDGLQTFPGRGEVVELGARRFVALLPRSGTALAVYRIHDDGVALTDASAQESWAVIAKLGRKPALRPAGVTEP
jgi:hypothetical protein